MQNKQKARLTRANYCLLVEDCFNGAISQAARETYALSIGLETATLSAAGINKVHPILSYANHY